MNPEDKYPALMAFIRDRSDEDEKRRRGTSSAQMKPLRLKVAMQELPRTSKTLRQIMRLLRSRRVEAVIPTTVTWASFLVCLFATTTSRHAATTLPAR